MKRIYAALTLAAAVCLAALSACEFGSGPGGTEGEGLTGILVDPQGSLAAHVQVRLYPHTSAAAAKSAVTAPHADSVLTDGKGRFIFRNLVTGVRYDLSASLIHGDTVFTVYLQNIQYTGGRQDLGNQTLAIGGGITLRIQSTGILNTDSVTCRISGSPFYGTVTSDGDCILKGLPAGIFQIEVSRPGYQVTLSDALTVVQGVLSDAGSIQLVPLSGPTPPKGRHFALGSSTVALWTFNAFEPGSFTNIPDLGPRGASLKMSDNARFYLTASPNDSAVVFPNTNPPGSDYLYAEPDSAYNPNRTNWLTLDARVYLTSYPSTANAASRAFVAGVANGPQLMIGSDGSLQLSALHATVGESITLPYPSTAAGTVPLGRWVDIAMTIDMANTEVYAFVDGKPVRVTWPAYSYLPDPPGYGFAMNRFSIGNNSIAQQPFEGRIDEVRVSNAPVLGQGFQVLYATTDPNATTAIDPASLVAWWDFEEGSGTVIRDKSGNGHDGTIVGSPAWVSDGSIGKALSFDGLTHVQVNAAQDFSKMHKSFTFSVWTRQADTAVTVRAPVMEFGLPADYAGTHLWLNTQGNTTQSPGSVYAHLRNAQGPTYTPTPDFSTSSGIVPTNEWAHIVLTFDSASALAKIYVNGSLVSTRSFTSPLVPSTEGVFYMGWRPSDSKDSDRGMHFNGQMDEMRLYKQALSDAQVRGLYLSRTTTKGKVAVVASADAAVSGPVPGYTDNNGILNRTGGLDPVISVGYYDVYSGGRTLLRFDLPPGYAASDITKAVIRLNVSSWATRNVHGAYRLDVHRMLKSWKEGVGTGAVTDLNSAALDGATGLERFWGTQDGSQKWSQPLIGLNDTDAAELVSASVSKLPGSTETWEFDITEIAKTWAFNPSWNYGVVLVSDFPATNADVRDYPLFHSRQAAVADSLKPTLILNGP